MIRYNTRDIVNKALQLADLVNSDFISYSENVTLLNDAYTKMYQNAINVGDLLYVKEMDLSENDIIQSDTGIVQYKLPNDFYQLYSVKAQTFGRTGFALPRRTKDGYEMDVSYELKNNTLIVYGKVLSSLKVEYFPVPETLFLSNEALPIKGINGTPVAYYKDIIVTYAPLDYTVTAYTTDDFRPVGSWKLFTKDPESQAPDPTIKFIKAAAGYNGVVVTFTENNIKKNLIADWDSTEPNITTALQRDIIVRQDDGILVTPAPESDIISMLTTESEVYSIRHTGDSDFIEGKKLPGTENQIDLFAEDKIFITNKEGDFSVFDINTSSLDNISNTFEKVICVGDYNLNTGYGMLVRKAGRGYFIKSPFVETKLDYPNNIYFSLIAYSLAMSYKIKQNADIAPLSITYNETLEQYYDMFKRDINAPLRMNNVYRI